MPRKKSTKKRGGQPRNVNALKHGFYSDTFKSGEIDDLDVYLQQGLADEIAMMRVVTKRVMTLADGTENLEGMIYVLGALGLAATRLAGLLRMQKMLGGDDSEVTRAVSEALSDVLKEWDRV